MSACRSCGERIIFAHVTTTGKAMPLDPEPNLTKGNVRVTFGGPKPQATVLGKRDAEAARAAGDTLYLSHFVNCPQANRYRKGRR